MALIVTTLLFFASFAHSQRLEETFQAEIFYDKDELNSGLYEGSVRGRRLFTSSAIPHGQGTIYFFNNDKFHRVNYTGEWSLGTRHGNGTTYFKDGSVYRGEYAEGVEEGVGFITYPDGNVLEGEFSNGKIHGNAVLKYPNGDQREGYFFENVLDGQVIYTKANGMIVIEFWKNGEPLPDKETVVQNPQKATSTPNPSKPVQISTETTSAGDFVRNTVIGPRSRLFFKSEDEQRQPKQKTEMDAEMLRKITDAANKSFLLSIFKQVNGR